MNCNINAYTGTEPYVYWIGCHRDDGISFPMLERLAKGGLRVWHDAQIRNNQAEWKSTTNQKLNDSSAVLVLLSQSFAETHICRRQFTDAIDSKKPIFIIKLENPSLTLGMTLQVSINPSRDCSFPPTDSLIDTILRHDAFSPCIGSPNPGVHIQAYTLESTEEKPALRPVRRIESSEETIKDLRAGGGNGAPYAKDEKKEEIKKSPTPSSNRLSGDDSKKEKPEPAGNKLDQTIISGNVSKSQEDGASGLDSTVVPIRIQRPTLLSLSTGHAQKGLSGETVVGRRTKPQTEIVPDISFEEQCKLFSRRHFKLICVDKTCTLVCLHENNLTLNGISEVCVDQPTRLEGACVIEVPGKSVLDQFSKAEKSSVRFVVAYENEAQSLWDAPYVATLESMETGEIRAFWDFPITIGRIAPWESGAMSAKTISTRHATITFIDNSFFYEDHSSNGTIINGGALCHQEKRQLQQGDVLHINGNIEEGQRDENFVFRFVKTERVSEL